VIKKKQIKILKEKIEKRENKGLIKRKIRAIVVGIPNVGKSTLINTLCGKTVAKAENRPGVTRSLEWLKISPDFEFIDSPGILGKKFSSQDEAFRLASLSSVNEAILNYQDLAIFIYEELRDKYWEQGLAENRPLYLTNYIYEVENTEFGDLVTYANIANKKLHHYFIMSTEYLVDIVSENDVKVEKVTS